MTLTRLGFCHIKKLYQNRANHFNLLKVIISKNLANLNKISFDLLIARSFPIALPPIVNEAIKLVKTRFTINTFIPYDSEIDSAMVIPAPPESIPHMSPMTSLQKLETLELFLIKKSAVFEPLTFLDAMELNIFLSATVALTPIMSKTIPKTIKNIKISELNKIETFGITVSEKNDNDKVMKNDIRII